MLAQGKSAGLITRRSSDRNRDMLFWIFFIAEFPEPSLSGTGAETSLRNRMRSHIFCCCCRHVRRAGPNFWTAIGNIHWAISCLGVHFRLILVYSCSSDILVKSHRSQDKIQPLFYPMRQHATCPSFDLLPEEVKRVTEKKRAMRRPILYIEEHLALSKCNRIDRNMIAHGGDMHLDIR